jgi:hypothetical protein
MYKTQHYAFCCDLTGVQVVRCVHKPNPLNPGGKGTDTDEIIWSGKIVVRDINSKTSKYYSMRYFILIEIWLE